MQMGEKEGKSRNTLFFQWFEAPEGRKVGSLKRRVRSQLARWEMKNCTPLWREAHFQDFPSQNVQSTPAPDHFWKFRCRKSARRCGAKHISKSKCTKHHMFAPLLEVQMSKKCTRLWREAHFQVKMYKTPHVRATFGSSDVEKVHAVVARSTFPSENVQNTTCSDHFWRLRCRLSKECTPLWREAHFEVKMYKTHHVRSTFGGSDVDFRKSARRCGAKHISKSKCTKHHMFAPLLEVQMSKKCTPLWREAHFQVKMYKTPHVRATFGSSDVEKVHAVVARSTFPSQNVQNTTCSRHFWKFRCRKSARGCGAKHISKSKCTKHHMFAPLLEVQMSKKCTPLWREAHFQVKMYKTHQLRTTFGSSDVEKVHAVVARSTFRSQKCKKLRVLSLFWRYNVEKVDTD